MPHRRQAPPRPFGTVVRDLLIEQDRTTPLGNPDWAAFAKVLPGISYESLRKAVTGERDPSPKIMETVATALDVDPGRFVEYRLWQARRRFDPAEVGSAAALRNLETWEAVAP